MKHKGLNAPSTMLLLVRGRQPKPITPFLAAIVMTAILTLPVVGAQAQVFTTLYSFTGGSDGAYPWNGLALDKAGHLYGMTTNGGIINGFGVVFELQSSQTRWHETVLHSFDGSDGCCPYFNNLVFDGKGNLYGTTSSDGNGYGTAFQLTPNQDGSWTENILHNFAGGGDGITPSSGVTFDAQGNLYGVTSGGGGKGCAEFAGCGVVYELSPASNGSWTETILHRFTGGADGSGPNAVLVDKQGRVYGTAVNGGKVLGSGVAFELAPSGTGWKFQVIYNFTVSSAYPLGPLAIDGQGNLYGTESVGGIFNAGAVFELTRPRTATGLWTHNTLYSFNGSTDGYNPTSGVTFDTVGNLYGTTSGGGISGSLGSVFELKSSQGVWAFFLLHGFTGGSDGDSPYAGVVSDSVGQLYGTTTNVQGGGWGTVYEVTP
jgi:hypothetical protein